MKRLHIFLIIVLALALLWYFLFWPALRQTLQGRKDLTSWEQKLAQAQESKKKLDDLKIKYQTVQDEESRILQAVPPSKDIPGLLVQMEALASQNGLILSSLNFVYPESESGVRASIIEIEEAEGYGSGTAESGGVSLPAGVKVLSVTLSLNGDYNSLKNFLRAVENNLRLTDVSKINFDESGDKTELGLGKLAIELSVYYKQ